jgi:hypothetical protein
MCLGELGQVRSIESDGSLTVDVCTRQVCSHRRERRCRRGDRASGDDGEGISDTARRSGLANLRSRAESRGGTLTVTLRKPFWSTNVTNGRIPAITGPLTLTHASKPVSAGSGSAGVKP